MNYLNTDLIIIFELLTTWRDKKMADITMSDLFDGLSKYARSDPKHSLVENRRRMLREAEGEDEEFDEAPPMDMEFGDEGGAPGMPPDDFGGEMPEMGTDEFAEVPEGESLGAMEDEDVVVIDTSEFKPDKKDYFVVSVDKDKEIDLDDELPEGSGVEEKIEIVDEEAEPEEGEEEGEGEEEEEEDEGEEEEDEKEVKETKRLRRTRALARQVREWKMAKYRTIRARRMGR